MVAVYVTRDTDIRVLTTSTTTTITSNTTTTITSTKFPNRTKTTINNNYEKSTLPTLLINYNTTNIAAH